MRKALKSTEHVHIIRRDMLCMMDGCQRLAMYDVSIIRHNGADDADWMSYCGTCAHSIVTMLDKRYSDPVTTS